MRSLSGADILNLVKRYCLLAAGLFVMALGIALSAQAGLGTTPISSVPYVLSLASPWSLGEMTVAMNAVFIALQLLLLRKRFPPLQLLQIPVTLVFGSFCDLALALVRGIPIPNYPVQLLLSLCSTLILALGVFLEVKANVVLLSGEGVIKAVSVVTKKEFGKLKIGFDCTLMLSALCLSLVFFRELRGVREGTLIAAVLAGTLVGQYNRRFAFLDRWLSPAKKTDDQMDDTVQHPLVVTISREYGSGGHLVGEILARKLGVKLYDKDLIAEVAQCSGLTEEFVNENDEIIPGALYQLYLQNNEYINEQETPYDRICQHEKQIIKSVARKESCVIIGRLANFILEGRPNAFHVFIHANEGYRTERVMKEYGLSENAARHKIRKTDTWRRLHCSHYTGRNWGHADYYDLCLDSALFHEVEIANIIYRVLKQAGLVSGK
jgi:Predicted membrane protein